MPQSRTHYFYYLFVLAIFLIIVGPSLFSEGMFMDGLFYAAVSNNMAEGLGTFWKPYLAEYYYKEFFEHPPLALGLQSIGFKIFGDSIYVERFYSLLCYLLTGYLISLIWKEITGEIKMGWLAILLWITVAIVPWACANNMLENTMTVFVCASVLLYLKYHKSENFVILIFSAFALCLALMTKGLVCLYVWALPFFLWLVFRKESFLKLLLRSIVFVALTLLPIFLLFLFSEPAANSISRYLNDQLFTSLNKIITVASRFHIVSEFIQNILIPLAIALCFVGVYYYKERSLKIVKSDYRMSIVLILLTLAGVLPIMVSLKQRGFYILTVYPFFTIALALAIDPIVKLSVSKISHLAIKRTSIVLFTIAVMICSVQIGRVGRDAERLADCKELILEVGEREIINIHPDKYSDWSLHGYLARYGQISLDTALHSQAYLYMRKNRLTHRDYETVIELPSSAYKLDKRSRNAKEQEIQE